MDLTTIEKTLKNGEYSSHKEFEADIEQMIQIAFDSTEKNSEMYHKTEEMYQYYKKGLRPIESNPIE